MANKIKHSIVTNWTSALSVSTDLDSKADGAAIAVGPVVANSTGLALLMDLSLLLGSITPTGSPYWEVHILPLLHDGTTYADRSEDTKLTTMQVTTGASAKAAFKRVTVPPGDFKIQLVNKTGQTTNAAGNSFNYRTSCLDDNA